jgi:hypothetical protein
MGCENWKDSEGRLIGVKCSRRKSTRCLECGEPMVALCDATKKDGTPCDAPMCEKHRYRVGSDTDVCKYHNYPRYIEQALQNRKERAEMESWIFKVDPEIEEYFLDQYEKAGFSVVPGHWPDMKTKEDVDAWICFMKKIIDTCKSRPVGNEN